MHESYSSRCGHKPKLKHCIYLFILVRDKFSNKLPRLQNTKSSLSKTEAGAVASAKGIGNELLEVTAFATAPPLARLLDLEVVFEVTGWLATSKGLKVARRLIAASTLDSFLRVRDPCSNAWVMPASKRVPINCVPSNLLCLRPES